MLLSPLTFGLAFAVVGLAIISAVWLYRTMSYRRLMRDLNMRLLLVRLPAGTEETKEKEALADINKTSQLLALLAKQNSPLIFEVAVHNVGEEIAFYVSVPKKMVESAMRAIQGLWNDAQVDFLPDDYTVFNPQGDAQAAYLKLKSHYALPIRNYLEAELDTFAPILSNFSKINALGEGLALQVIVTPAPRSAKKTIMGFISKLKRGEKMSDVFERKLLTLPKTKQKEAEEQEEKNKVIDQEGIKTLEDKMSKPLFNVNVRMVSSAPTPFRASELLDSLTGSFSQFSAPLRNEFKIVKPGNPKNGIFKYVFREYDASEAMLLNGDEVASLFHLPIATTLVPRLKAVRAREAAPPMNIPKEGLVIGESVFRGEVRPIYVTDDDRRRHFYVIGQTGTGKSELLKNFIAQDIAAGKGVAVVDPHGDLIDSVLSAIPRERYKDVIIFDPGDRMYPLGLNMLEYDSNFPEQKTFIVNEMQSIFNKLFPPETMGPMFEQYMRNALMLLMEDTDDPATLMEVPRVFTDVEFRKIKLARARNPTVIDFWEKEAVKAGGEASLANMTPYITSKFNNFIANDYVRPIIGQPKSAFNFRKVMDDGKILLVNLSKGRIGDINAGLLGMVVVGKLLMSALSRVDMPQEQRRDFNLYIDEFQNFTTDSIATILSEARKYRLNLVIAHQFIAQLAEKIRDAVFGNVGSMVVFRVGADDAEFLVKQFDPVFTKTDLINIDNYNAYVKLLIAGQTAKPFNIRTLKAPAGTPGLRDSLKELSRKVYGASRHEVEEDILKRLRA